MCKMKLASTKKWVCNPQLVKLCYEVWGYICKLCVVQRFHYNLRGWYQTYGNL